MRVAQPRIDAKAFGIKKPMEELMHRGARGAQACQQPRAVSKTVSTHNECQAA